LAYLTAKTHGLEEEAERLCEKIKAKSKERKEGDEPLPDGQEPEGLDIVRFLPAPNEHVLTESGSQCDRPPRFNPKRMLDCFCPPFLYSPLWKNTAIGHY